MESSEICNYQIHLQQSHSNRSDAPVLMNVISKHRMWYPPTCPCSSGYGWNERCLLDSLFCEEPSQCNDAQLINEWGKQTQLIWAKQHRTELFWNVMFFAISSVAACLPVYASAGILAQPESGGSWLTHEHGFSIERAEDVHIYKSPCCQEWVPPTQPSL